jgi:UDP-N-acetylglucosamine 2-epimerase (non-hydrolysing)
MEEKVCIFTGARPNFVKAAPIIRAIQHTDGISHQLVYAGRPDDPTLEPS